MPDPHQVTGTAGPGQPGGSRAQGSRAAMPVMCVLAPMALRASSRSAGRSTQASGCVACMRRRMYTSAPTAPS